LSMLAGWLAGYFGFVGGWLSSFAVPSGGSAVFAVWLAGYAN
jgi:hypothetical protein